MFQVGEKAKAKKVEWERFTSAAWEGHAPLPRGGAPRGLGAAGQVALVTGHGAGRIVAEASEGMGAHQASMLGVFLGLTGHS